MVVALRDVDPRVGRTTEHRLEAREVRVVRLVRRNVLRGYDRVERLRQPALGERDEVAVAVGEERQLPTIGVNGAKGRPDVGKDRPVRNRRRQRRRVIVLEVEVETCSGAPQGFRQYDAIAAKRFFLLDLGLDLYICG